ncbi:MAG: hypothetical protein Kow00114_04660 [Kiloniellaceae bacterium]
MSDLIAPPEMVAKMDALERPHRLPASDGGGVVFPFGFFGPGYHLSEAEYPRFSALADYPEDDAQASTWWQRHKRRLLNLVVWATIAAAWIISLYLDHRITDSVVWNVGGVLISSLGYWRIYRRFGSHSRRIKATFPSARRLPIYQYWQPRTGLAARDTKICSCLTWIFFSSVFGLLAFLFFGLVEDGTVHAAVAIAIAPILLFFTVYPPFVVVCLAIARLRYNPTTEPTGLEPVKPPKRAT